jgi:hypothetical protein
LGGRKLALLRFDGRRPSDSRLPISMRADARMEISSLL